ncbi:MAG: family 78 glycoside hydrolase catalytic domain [Chthonomonadales bacterium]
MSSPLLYLFTAGVILMGIPASAQKPVNLKVNHQTNPLIIDSGQPVLSWQIEDGRRGARQTAYEIRAASREELLKSDRADIVDTKKVVSDASVNIPWPGKSLASKLGVYWSVRVWDQNEKPSAWSKPSYFGTGLHQSDWRASWIGLKSIEAPKISLAKLKWIWYPEGDPHANAPAGERFFRTSVTLPIGKPIKSATLIAAADDSFMAFVNGTKIGEGTSWQNAPSFNVANLLKSGATNTVAISAKNASPSPAGIVSLLTITFSDGTMMKVSTTKEWKCSHDMAPGWEKPGFGDTKWIASMEIATVGDQPWGVPSSGTGIGGPATRLRKDFALTRRIKSATLYATARGAYEFHINGARVGDAILAPGWTDFRKRILYQAHDVTKLVKQGDNALAATVGDGWYASGLGWTLQRNCFGPAPNSLLAELHVRYLDESEDVIISDGSWSGSTSPILRSEIYAGETYDARLEQPGWEKAGFAGKGWMPVDFTMAANAPAWQGDKEPDAVALITAQNCQEIEVTETVKPIGMTNPAKGVYVIDMGQNMVGWLKVHANGPAGSTIKLRFAEILQANGNIYTDNLRKAEATDKIILNGSPLTFEPHFTYHGFRYVEVTGWTGKPSISSFEGKVFHTAAPRVGKFACSSELVNQLSRNIDWGLRGNLESVPTDCPQRDERLGWMGDAQIIWSTACYNRDMSSFTSKFMRDIVEAQSKEGGFPDVAPRVIDMADGAPAWGDAGIIVPYAAWRHYDDTTVVREHWAAMKHWIEYISSQNPNYLWLKRRNNDFGDWVPANSETDKNLIATCYWAYDCQLMEKMGRAIGEATDANFYHDMYLKIRDAFNTRFVHEDGTIANGSQTCYALALHMNMLDEKGQALAMKHLVRDIEKCDMHLSTGFLGSPYLMLVLTEHGRSDVAYKLLMNDTFPSWGYMIKKGATTMWERWNGDTGDPGMNSFNHYAYGAVGEWMYRYAAGIQIDAETPGFKHMTIHPYIDDKMDFVTGEVETLYGIAKSAWKKLEDGSLQFDVTVPANTTATVYVPAKSGLTVTESDVPIGSQTYMAPIKRSGDSAIFSVAAGTYHFLVK